MSIEKNGDTKFELKYVGKVNEIADTYTTPLVREHFLQFVEYCRKSARELTSQHHAGLSDAELAKELEKDTGYGLLLTESVSLAQRLCDSLETAFVEGKKQRTALEMRVKEIEATMQMHDATKEKLEQHTRVINNEYKTRKAELDAKTKEIDGQYDWLKTERAKVEDAQKASAEKEAAYKQERQTLNEGFKLLEQKEAEVKRLQEELPGLVKAGIATAKKEAYDVAKEIVDAAIAYRKSVELRTESLFAAINTTLDTIHQERLAENEKANAEAEQKLVTILARLLPDELKQAPPSNA